MEGEALFDALEEAERTRLIVERSVGRSTAYAFVHKLIRQTLVEALSLPRRQRKHLHISEAMERAYGDRLGEHASDYSYHLYQAGAAVDENKTIHFLRIGGVQALDGAAFEEALRQFDLALSIEEHPEERTHAELLRDRGTAMRGLGRWEEAAQQWEEAATTVRGTTGLKGGGSNVSRHLANQSLGRPGIGGPRCDGPRAGRDRDRGERRAG